MKISVIIPVFNSEMYLARLLSSIKEQTYKDYEIIIVDDGSTDKSLEVINNFKDEKMKCISIENSGPGIARKKGFELATGELLFFIDADDFLPNKKAFEKINKIYSKSKFDILFFKYIVGESGKEKTLKTVNDRSNLKEGLYDTKYLEKHRLVGALWSKVFVAEKMKVDFFCNYNNFEDYYTTYMYLNECKNFYFVDEIFYYTDRDNINSISKKLDEDKMFNTVNLLKMTYEKTNYKMAFSKAMYYYYMFIRRIIDKSKLPKDKEKEQLNKINELKPYFNLKNLLILQISFKEVLKYIYYMVKDRKRD